MEPVQAVIELPPEPLCLDGAQSCPDLSTIDEIPLVDLTPQRSLLSASEKDDAVGSEYDTYDGSCAKAVPIVSESDALAVLILQIFVPGVGAILAAYRSVDGFNCPSLGHGIG